VSKTLSQEVGFDGKKMHEEAQKVTKKRKLPPNPNSTNFFSQTVSNVIALNSNFLTGTSWDISL